MARIVFSPPFPRAVDVSVAIRLPKLKDRNVSRDTTKQSLLEEQQSSTCLQTLLITVYILCFNWQKTVASERQATSCLYLARCLAPPPTDFGSCHYSLAFREDRPRFARRGPFCTSPRIRAQAFSEWSLEPSGSSPPCRLPSLTMPSSLPYKAAREGQLGPSLCCWRYGPIPCYRPSPRRLRG